MIETAMMAMLLAFPNPLAGLHLHHESDFHRSHQVVNGWRIEAIQDRFSGRTACRIRNHNVTFDRGVVTFHFPSSVDTANAIFRIDGGPPQSVGSVAVEVAGLGARLQGDNSTNPSSGLVPLPSRLLSTANTVSIEPNYKRQHRDFSVHGLSGALDVARQKGCDLGEHEQRGA